MDEGIPTLAVGFTIEMTDAFGNLRTMDDMLGETAATAVRAFNQMKTASTGALNLTGATASMTSFGTAATRELASVARESRNAEKAGEAMIRQIARQAETFGKTSSQIRQMRAEMAAMRAEDAGLTELADRLRATSAEMDRLEAAQGGAIRSTGAHRAAMQGLSFQAQDAFTQISMGTNVLSVLAIQGGQAAGQLANLDGKLGAVANFLIGPWGLAITGALLVLGALTDQYMKAAAASDTKKASVKSLTESINDLNEATGRQIKSEQAAQTETLRSAAALRQQALDARAAAIEVLRVAQANFASARATNFGAAGGAGAGMATAIYASRVGDAEKQLKAMQEALEKANVTFRQAEIPIMQRRVNEAFDKAAAATGRYDRAVDALNSRYAAGRITQSGYDAELRRLTAARDRETEAAKASGGAVERHTQATRGNTAAVREQAQAQRELMSDFEEVIRQYDPARAAAAAYVRELEKISKLRAAGMISAGDAAVYAGAATDERQKQADEARRARFGAIFGQGDPLGDLVSGIDRNRQADFEQMMAARNDALRYQAELLDTIAANADRAGRGLADAFGEAGRSIGALSATFAGYVADQERLSVWQRDQLKTAASMSDVEERTKKERQTNTLYALRSSALQIDAFGDMAAAAKGFAKEGSTAYEAIAAAEKAFRVAQFAMSVAALAQNAAETFGFVANAGVRATADGTAGIAAQAKLPFPLNIVAMGATAAALVAAGVAIVGAIGGGGSKTQPVTNTGTGTVLGDGKAQSESIKRSIDALREVDLLTNTYSRQMAASLKSIDSQIGGVAAQIARAGNIDASSGVTEGFKRNAIGSVLGAIPVIGGLLGSLFGSTTTVTGSGLFAGPQSVGSILGNGFDAQYYSDISKTSKFLGIKTGTKTSTQFTGADAALEGQFTLLLKSFSDAIGAAAGPLGIATDDIAARVNGFVVSLGRIDTKGLTGTEIQEKLSAVFGAAADGMAAAAVPGIERFQKVGEGAFETLIRVASTVESVSTSLDLLGTAARALGIDAKLGLADQFDSLGDLSSAVDAYFQAYFTKEEQAEAKTAQLTRVMGSLGFSLPTSIAGFRQLVEAQDLTTAAGQAAYATLLQLAPAFADLQSAMEGAKSAADIAAERQDLQRQLLELQGNTAALRALDLAKLDVSNRALQEQIYAIQDAQEAAKAADELRQAWQSVGDSVTEEIKRIRGLTTAGTGAGFAQLQGQFNAATAAARGGDQDAAKSLPGLSQSLLTAAAQMATSRQELARVQAQTAASLEATNASIARLAGNATAAGLSNAAIIAAAATTQAASSPTAANDQRIDEVVMLRTELADMKEALVGALAAVAGPVTRMDKRLDAVTQDSGGNAISTRAAAA